MPSLVLGTRKVEIKAKSLSLEQLMVQWGRQAPKWTFNSIKVHKGVSANPIRERRNQRRLPEGGDA